MEPQSHINTGGHGWTKRVSPPGPDARPPGPKPRTPDFIESSTRRQIRLAARSIGLGVEEMEWAPIGYGSEMQGARGGWTVFLSNGVHVLGYNAAEVIEWILKWGNTSFADESMDDLGMRVGG